VGGDAVCVVFVFICGQPGLRWANRQLYGIVHFLGRVEGFLLVLSGQLAWQSMLNDFVLPVLAGKHCRGHRAVCPYRLCASHERDLAD